MEKAMAVLEPERMTEAYLERFVSEIIAGVERQRAA
jgi:hypothetical protein